MGHLKIDACEKPSLVDMSRHESEGTRWIEGALVEELQSFNFATCRTQFRFAEV